MLECDVHKLQEFPDIVIYVNFSIVSRITVNTQNLQRTVSLTLTRLILVPEATSPDPSFPGQRSYMAQPRQ